jgi:hypothetical protein
MNSRQMQEINTLFVEEEDRCFIFYVVYVIVLFMPYIFTHEKPLGAVEFYVRIYRFRKIKQKHTNWAHWKIAILSPVSRTQHFSLKSFLSKSVLISKGLKRLLLKVEKLGMPD